MPSLSLAMAMTLAPAEVAAQAIVFDRGARRVVFGINRSRREAAGFWLAPVEAK